jgi:hypothetical protein
MFLHIKICIKLTEVKLEKGKCSKHNNKLEAWFKYLMIVYEKVNKHIKVILHNKNCDMSWIKSKQKNNKSQHTHQ